MKKIVLLCAVAVVCSAAPAFAASTLQWWNFNKGEVSAVQSINPTQWNAWPTFFDNPNPQPLGGDPYALITTGRDGTYSETGGLGNGGSFTGVDNVALFIGNYDNDNPTKYIDLLIYHSTGSAVSNAMVGSPGTSLTVNLISETTTSPYDGWDLTRIKWELHPNPSWEAITFTLDNAGLASIVVATECVPAPGAILLGLIGTGVVGWMRRRRAL